MAASKQKTDRPKASVTEFLERERSKKRGNEATMDAPVHRCVHCGISTMKPQDHFYKSMGSRVYLSTDGYAPICKTCLKELYQEALKEYKSVDLALEVCCHYLDWPFIPTLARAARDARTDYPFGDYASSIAFPKYNKLTFGQSLKQQLLERETSASAREEQEKRWPASSLKNMSYVTHIVGYDPFSDGTYTSDDRRFLFDTMAGYCPDSTIANDSHKLQSIMNIVQLLLQSHKIEDQILIEMSKNPINSVTIGKLTNIQKNILQTVNATAKENAISASGSGGIKTANTLTEKMKQIMDEGFMDIEVNAYDIKQSKAFREISDISLRSILSELRMEDNDYSEIVTEQLERIESLTKERDDLAEEVRLLKNKEILKQQELQE